MDNGSFELSIVTLVWFGSVLVVDAFLGLLVNIEFDTA